MSKVMIVDDSADTGAFCEMVAGVLGLDALHVDNVERALGELGQGNRPEVILLDYYIPGDDPQELVKAVRAMKSMEGTRVVLMSSIPDIQDFASEMGVDGVLPKPFQPQDLRKCLAG